jgi:phospholipid-transporting ATPase
VNREYGILNINEFNSTRKRMSVVVKCPDGLIKLYVKGADTVIFERLVAGSPNIAKTTHYLEEYANEGLRTLCLAYRVISQTEYEQWQQVYDVAAASLVERQKKLDEAAELIEKNLTLLGATAIEDKLQDGVPDAIHTMMEAGIKVWVLTGDRQETAINIGYSCKLITPDMNLLVCNEPTPEATKSYLEGKLASVKAVINNSVNSRVKVNLWERFLRNMKSSDNGKFNKDYGFDMEPMALVIDGGTLKFALEPSIAQTFLELAMVCKAVVCCRVSPLQKALVVKLVRKNVARSVTLAIGDGANDVSMIQAAHVGVGISGQEGLQAARSADFSISQFRFLRKLLLVHGSWAYSRIAKVIVYCFYKNITLYLVQFWFAINNGFSGQTLFETWSSVSSYNVLWTLLPPFVIGLFDQFLSANVLDRYPQLYRLGQTDTFYNNKVFFGWVINSFFHSLAIFYIWSFTLGESAVQADGHVLDNWAWGQMVYVTDLLTVLLKACLTIDYWVLFTFVGVFGSLVIFFALFPPVTCFNLVCHNWCQFGYLSRAIQSQLSDFWISHLLALPTVDSSCGKFARRYLEIVSYFNSVIKGHSNHDRIM